MLKHLGFLFLHDELFGVKLTFFLLKEGNDEMRELGKGDYDRGNLGDG